MLDAVSTSTAAIHAAQVVALVVSITLLVFMVLGGCEQTSKALACLPPSPASERTKPCVTFARLLARSGRQGILPEWPGDGDSPAINFLAASCRRLRPPASPWPDAWRCGTCQSSHFTFGLA